VWGGKETNRVGSHEFVGLCRRVGAHPLYCVNFLGDGEQKYRNTAEGDRTGDAKEAADWVSYANDPSSVERRQNGSPEPLNIRLWQLGNETSYGNATFTKDECIRHTIGFARAMKSRDSSIRLIGWGDRGRGTGLWGPDLLRQAGEHLEYVAIHMMGQSPRREDTMLRGLRYQRDPARAWEELLELADQVERRVIEFEDAISGIAPHVGIAITEGHLSLSPHNANPILSEWLSAVYHARSLNIYQRHGARVKIATAADFQGNRWTVNCVMLQTPGRVSYLMPVGSVAGLFRRYNGTHGVRVRNHPPELDIAASRKGNRLFLHVANVSYSRAVEASFAVNGMTVTSGEIHTIAPQDLRQYVNHDQPDAFRPLHLALTGPVFRWRFPAGSVTAVELDCI
jgi:alpha-L-arabinofuranosidase